MTNEIEKNETEKFFDELKKDVAHFKIDLAREFKQFKLEGLFSEETAPIYFTLKRKHANLSTDKIINTLYHQYFFEWVKSYLFDLLIDDVV